MLTWTPRELVERIRTAIYKIESLLVNKKGFLLSEELVELCRIREELRAGLSKLEQRPWPSARWHARDPVYSRQMTMLITRVEHYDVTSGG